MERCKWKPRALIIVDAPESYHHISCLKHAIKHTKPLLVQGQNFPTIAHVTRREKPTISYDARITWASMLSSVIATAFIAPLNSIKLVAIELKISSLMDFKRLFDYMNFKFLYRGYMTSIMRFVPRHAIEHTVYGILRTNSCMSTSVAGTLSSLLSVMIMTPVDNVHIRHVLGKSVTSVCLYNGLIPAMIQSACHGCLWYTTIEKLNGIKQIRENCYAKCGICALICSLALHPIDVLKTVCGSHGTPARTAFMHLLRKRGFFRGLSVVALTTVPCHTISYGTFNAVRSILIGE